MSSAMRRSGFRSAVERPMVGDTKTSMVRVDHLGWLVCDGRSLLKSEYRALYAILGDDFGSVDANHFNLPDAQGRVVGLIGQADVTTWVDGDVSGEETHTLTIEEIPAHNHDISDNDPSSNGVTSENGTHSHNIDRSSNADPGAFDTADANAANPRAATTDRSLVGGAGNGFDTYSAGDHRHEILSNGGSQPHNNIQPTLFMGNLFIYCGQPGKNITEADGVTPRSTNPSFYPPSVPANRLY